MRMSELLGRQVVDAAGEGLGKVEDVRLLQDGPVLGGFGAALRVDGLLVSGRSVAVRLGFHRGGVQGPWPLRTFFLVRERGCCYVDWDQVAEWDGDVIRLRVAKASLRSIGDATG
jgi:hypothetical protein